MSLKKKSAETAPVSKREAAEIKAEHKQDFKKLKKSKKEELTLEAAQKMQRLIPILNKDARSLGIQQVTIQIVPEKNLEYVAFVEGAGYDIKGDGGFTIPDGIQFSYDAVELLTEEELRAIAWHEFGHVIYWYFFPDSADNYDEDEDHYVVQETFCDEFAYRKFGDVLLTAQLKIEDTLDKTSKEKTENKIGILQKIYGMRRFKKRYGKHEYWLNLADTLGIVDEIKYDPADSGVIGVKPKRNILKGMYHKKH